MMPSGKSRLTRWVGISSILVLIAGSFMALYVLMISASLPINISGPLVLGVLWLTNLVSALVTAIYGFSAAGRAGWCLSLWYRSRRWWFRW